MGDTDVTNSATAGVLTAITYSGTTTGGFLDTSRATAATNYTGGLTLTTGTVPGGRGASANAAG